MKTKKGLLKQTWQLLAFVAIALCSFTLSACGDDDDAQSIVGKWILEKGEYAMTNPITGEVVRGTYNGSTDNGQVYYHFNGKGVCTYTEANSDYQPRLTEYIYDPEKQIIGVGISFYRITHISSTQLVWEKSDADDANYLFRETFVRE
jgi:lipoprotein